MNVHEKWRPLSPDEVGEQLETLASPDDRIWHSKLARPMVLSDSLAVGPAGGHGPVHYTVGKCKKKRLALKASGSELLQGRV